MGSSHISQLGVPGMLLEAMNNCHGYIHNTGGIKDSQGGIGGFFKWRRRKDPLSLLKGSRREIEGGHHEESLGELQPNCHRRPQHFQNAHNREWPSGIAARMEWGHSKAWNTSCVYCSRQVKEVTQALWRSLDGHEWIPSSGHWLLTCGTSVLLRSGGECALVLPSWG